MMPNIGLNLSCNSNCSRWCPRVLKVACCCCCKIDDDEKETIEKTDEISKKVLDKKEPK